METHGLQFLPLYLIPIWVGIPFLIAYLGGWRKLSVHYRWNGEPVAKEWWRWRSLNLGITHYGSSVNIGNSERGLFFSTIWIIKFGHPPLFVPWQDVTSTNSTRFFIPVTRFTFRKESSVRVTLQRGLAEKILKACPPRSARNEES